MTGPFRILLVCTGNVCRSPVAERMLRAGLARRLGPEAAAIDVASAGVRALVGEPMDPPSADSLRRHGGDPDGFVARALDAGMVATADLVLVATRRHRATVVRMVPSSVTRTFTIREFARLAQHLDVTTLPDGPPRRRLEALVRDTGALRGLVPKEGRGTDDLADPYGRPSAAHRETASLIRSTLAPVVDVLVAAAAPTHVDAAVDAAEQRRREARGRALASTRADRRAAARRRSRRIALLAAGVIVAGLLVLMAWQAAAARRELAAARPDVARFRAAVVGGDPATAHSAVRDLRRHAASARGALSGPWWFLAEGVPVVGDDVDAVRTVTRTVDDLARTALPAMLEATDQLGPDSLRVADDRVALRPLEQAAPSLQVAAAAVAQADRSLSAVEPARLVPPVRGPVTALTGQVGRLADLTRDAAATARLLPPLLGSEGPRRYFLAFQNNAEARATGGLLGAYGILEARDGRLSVTQLGSNTKLADAPRLPVDLGEDFTRLYGDDPRLWVNANLSPHFPYAARIWLALWRAQHGADLDGVVATDPVALGYLLEATGPATLPRGGTITSANAARLTMRDVYDRYPSAGENAIRDRYLQTIAGTVIDKVLGGGGDPRRLVRALRTAVSERRLLVFSTDEDLESQLSPFTVSGVVPDDARPYLAVTVNSAVPSKLDYYLDRSVAYVSRSCEGVHRRAHLTITLTNEAPAHGLPDYVALPRRSRGVPQLADAPRGSNYLLVDVLAPEGSGLARATLDGRPVGASVGRQRGHPVFSFDVTLRPGERRRLGLDLVAPRTNETVEIEQQPLVLPLTVSRVQDAC